LRNRKNYPTNLAITSSVDSTPDVFEMVIISSSSININVGGIAASINGIELQTWYMIAVSIDNESFMYDYVLYK